MRIEDKIDKYLNEAYVFMDSKFIKSVEKYVDKNNIKDLSYVIKNKNNIPSMFRKSGVYFRGMIVDEETHTKILNGSFVFRNPCSWTSDSKIAIKFINDPKYRIGTKKGVKLLLKKNIKENDIILNVYDYIMYMNMSGHLEKFDDTVLDSASKEFETIIDKISLTKKDIYKVL